jgi:hypothetical protein
MLEIFIYPSDTGAPRNFLQLVQQTAQSGQDCFGYEGEAFYFERDENGMVTGVFCCVNEASGLPSIFRTGRLSVGRVLAWTAIPAPLVSPPGRYDGTLLGYEKTIGCVDPRGQTTNGRPMIYAVSTDYQSAVYFLYAVLQRRAEPVEQF